MAKCKGKTAKGKDCNRNAPADSDYCCEKHDPNGSNTIKRDWYETFLTAFLEFGMVTTACRHAKIGRTTFYDAMKDDPEFAESFKFIEEEVTEQLEAEAFRRAHDGTTKPTQFGDVQVYSDTLLIFLLKARRPEKYRERVDVRHSGKIGTQPADTGDIQNPTREAEVARILDHAKALADGVGRN